MPSAIRLNFCLLVALVLATTAPNVAADDFPTERPTRFEYSQPHMGTLFHLRFYADDKKSADQTAAAAYARIAELNQVMSDYDADSELSQLSRSSPTDTSAPVSNDLWQVLLTSQQLSAASDGAFDVTVGPYTRLWRRARRRTEYPKESRLMAAAVAVGYRHLVVDAEKPRVQLTQPNMRFDLGGIGKGYAIDAALTTLKEHGITRALVDGGGDLAVSDPPPGRAGWRIGIAPLEEGGEPSRYLSLKNCGIATSGDLWQHVVIDGSRYSHIIDPRTGVPLTLPSSVTVIASNCTLADGLASAVSVLGPDDGIELVRCGKVTKNAEALFVYQQDDARHTVETAKFDHYEVE